jgi:hypothetical protein
MDEDSIQTWVLVESWLSAVRYNGGIAPSEIKGAEKILDCQKFLNLLCPWQLSSEHKLKSMDDKEKEERRAKAEAELSEWLEMHGC